MSAYLLCSALLVTAYILYIPTKKTMNVFSTDRLNTNKFVIVFITYYTFTVDLMDFYGYTLGTILCRKVVLVM